MPKRVGRRLCPSCFPSLLTRHTVRSATRNHCLDSFGLGPTLGWIDGFNPQHRGPAQGPMSAWACITPWENVLANGVSLLARERITCLCTSSMRAYCAQSKHLACMRKPIVRGRSRHGSCLSRSMKTADAKDPFNSVVPVINRAKRRGERGEGS